LVLEILDPRSVHGPSGRPIGPSVARFGHPWPASR